MVLNAFAFRVCEFRLVSRQLSSIGSRRLHRIAKNARQRLRQSLQARLSGMPPSLLSLPWPHPANQDRNQQLRTEKDHIAKHFQDSFGVGSFCE